MQYVVWGELASFTQHNYFEIQVVYINSLFLFIAE